MDSTGRRLAVASAWWLLALLPLFALGERHILWGADEPREAEIARELVATGDWVVPRLNGTPFLEKPPLAHWGAALVFTALGEASQEWCRVPSAIWAAFGTAACAWLGAMLFGWRVGALAAFVLATSWEWLSDAHTLLVDTPLAGAVAGALAFFWCGYSSMARLRADISYLLAAACCGLAFLAKGPIGVVLPATGVLAFVVWRREWSVLRHVLAPVNVGVFAGLTVPWLCLVRARGGPAVFRTLFFENMLVRFFSGNADHAAPPWDYGPSLLGVMVPWSLFIPPVLVALARPGVPAEGDQRRRWQFLVAISAAPLLLLSLASAKRPVYLLPLMPGFAIAVAAWLSARLSRTEPRWMRSWRVVGTFALGFVAVAAWGTSIVLAARDRHGMTAAVLGMAGALGAAGAFALDFFHRHRCRHAAFAAVFAFLTGLSLLSPPTFDALEARRGYGTLVAAVTEVATPGTTLYGYGMGERELGVVCFLRRTPVPQVGGPEELGHVLAEGDSVAVVSGAAAQELLISGRWPNSLEIVAAPAMRSRPFVLVRRRP